MGGGGSEDGKAEQQRRQGACLSLPATGIRGVEEAGLRQRACRGGGRRDEGGRDCDHIPARTTCGLVMVNRPARAWGAPQRSQTCVCASLARSPSAGGAASGGCGCCAVPEKRVRPPGLEEHGRCRREPLRLSFFPAAAGTQEEGWRHPSFWFLGWDLTWGLALRGCRGGQIVTSEPWRQSSPSCCRFVCLSSPFHSAGSPMIPMREPR